MGKWALLILMVAGLAVAAVVPTIAERSAKNFAAHQVQVRQNLADALRGEVTPHRPARRPD